MSVNTPSVSNNAVLDAKMFPLRFYAQTSLTENVEKLQENSFDDQNVNQT